MYNHNLHISKHKIESFLKRRLISLQILPFSQNSSRPGASTSDGRNKAIVIQRRCTQLRHFTCMSATRLNLDASEEQDLRVEGPMETASPDLATSRERGTRAAQSRRLFKGLALLCACALSVGSH